MVTLLFNLAGLVGWAWIIDKTTGFDSVDHHKSTHLPIAETAYDDFGGRPDTELTQAQRWERHSR